MTKQDDMICLATAAGILHKNGHRVKGLEVLLMATHATDREKDQKHAMTLVNAAFKKGGEPCT